MAGLSIKDAPLVEGVKEDIKIPISDGTNSAKTISIRQIKNFILKLFGKVAVSNDYNDLDNKPAIPDAITEADIENMGFTKNAGDYVKPSNGIPKIDLDKDVQSSLDKADSALQKIPSEYVTEEKLNNKVDKVEGKQLSTEDFTTLLRQKLEGLSNYDDSEIVAAFNQLRTEFNTLVGGNVSVAINSFNEVIAFLEGIEDSQKLDSIIASIEQQIADVARAVPTKVSQLANDSGFLTEHQDISNLATKSEVEKKQDVINDLDTIRSGAAKGATALQSYIEQYQGTVTGIKINGTTKNPSNGIIDLGTVITQHQDISNKADKDKYNNYSTDEVRIGTWINGKPIYRKTLIYTCDDLTKTKFWAYYPADTTGTEISQLNIDAYTNMSGVTFCANQAVTTGAWQPIPRVCPDANEAYNIGFGDLKPTRVGVLFGNKYLSATVYLTIEYTKTTD